MTYFGSIFIVLLITFVCLLIIGGIVAIIIVSVLSSKKKKNQQNNINQNVYPYNQVVTPTQNTNTVDDSSNVM